MQAQCDPVASVPHLLFWAKSTFCLWLVRATTIPYPAPKFLPLHPRIVDSSLEAASIPWQYAYACVCLIPWDAIHFPSPGILGEDTLRAIILRKQLTQFQAPFVFPHGSFITGSWLVKVNPYCTSVASPMYNCMPGLSQGNYFVLWVCASIEIEEILGAGDKTSSITFWKSLLILEDLSPDITIYICTCNLPSTKDFLSIGAVIIF